MLTRRSFVGQASLIAGGAMRQMAQVAQELRKSDPVLLGEMAAKP